MVISVNLLPLELLDKILSYLTPRDRTSAVLALYPLGSNIPLRCTYTPAIEKYDVDSYYLVICDTLKSEHRRAQQSFNLASAILSNKLQAVACVYCKNPDTLLRVLDIPTVLTITVFNSNINEPHLEMNHDTNVSYIRVIDSVWKIDVTKIKSLKKISYGGYCVERSVYMRILKNSNITVSYMPFWDQSHMVAHDNSDSKLYIFHEWHNFYHKLKPTK
jgi:hypothetical protein